ncbi:MAG: response regulator [Pseudomonadota bacterium]|nr:response regulator [Pseudomonadota bacterium]
MNATDDTPSACAEPPRLLLVEDDPTSSAFLSAALRSTPARVDCAATAAAARALSELHRYDLWLVDAQLPDGNGIDLLARLRKHRPRVRALAHTASTEPALHRALIDAGFAQVLVKPLPAIQLQSAVRRALEPSPAQLHDRPGAASVTALWDEESAARAMNFNRSHLDALRALFLQELPQARQAVMAAAHAGDLAAMAAGLHRLQASCGFVGAARLRAAVLDLQAAPSSHATTAAFDRAAQATIEHARADQDGGSGSGPGEETRARDE